jgi:hypothetical protein
MGVVAKSYMKKGFLMYGEMRKYLTIYERPLVIYDFATALHSRLDFLLYEENFVFFFIRAICFSLLLIKDIIAGAC